MKVVDLGFFFFFIGLLRLAKMLALVLRFVGWPDLDEGYACMDIFFCVL